MSEQVANLNIQEDVLSLRIENKALREVIIDLEARNKELQEENELLKKGHEINFKNWQEQKNIAMKTSAELYEAKKTIRMVIDSYNHEERFSFEKDLAKAEAFLKE